MKINQKLLNNRFLLDFVFIIAFLTFFSNLIYGNFHAVVLFMLLGYLTHCLSKNMTVVLFVPLLIVNLYTRFVQPRMMEGLSNQNSSSNSNSKNNSSNSSSKNNNQNQNQNSSSSLTSQQKINIMKKNNSNSSSSQGLPITPINDQSSSGPGDESFENNDEQKPTKKNKYNIDYASTVEEAYDNLNKIIGGDGIKNLTSDTQRLMEQQLQLTEAMKNIQPLVETMGPLLEKAGGLLGSMGGSENISNLANLAKNFTPNK